MYIYIYICNTKKTIAYSDDLLNLADQSRVNSNVYSILCRISRVNKEREEKYKRERERERNVGKIQDRINTCFDAVRTASLSFL